MTRIVLENGKKHQFDKLLFDPQSNLLNAYIDLIIKPSMPPEVFTYSRILVDYAVSNGKIVNLFEAVANHELDVEMLKLHKFNSTSPLMRLYHEYSNNVLLDFGKSVLPEILQTLISNVNSSYNSLITKLCNKTITYLKLIPIHYIRTLQIINEVVERKQGKPNVDFWVYETFFFTKFLCPLLDNPYNLLDNVSQEQINLSQRRIKQFSQYVAQIITNQKGNEKIVGMMHEVVRYISRPICISIHQSGLNIDEQNRLHPLIVAIFRDNQAKIFDYIARRDKDAKISPATQISPEVIYSRMGTVFTQSIQACVLKMNQLQALHDCNRNFLNYEKEYERRAELIESENIQFRDYLLLLQQQIEVIQLQIEEEKQTREKLQQKVKQIEEEERVTLK